MTSPPATQYTAFQGPRFLASGPLIDVLKAVLKEQERSPELGVLVFDECSGKENDFDLRGTLEEVLARVMPTPGLQEGRARGGLSMGVQAREVSLLPRHWDWLAEQPHGMSAAIRRPVDDAKKHESPEVARRRRREALGRIMSMLSGDMPGFEEAMRALYSDDRDTFLGRLSIWPEDLLRYYSSRWSY